MNEAVLTLADLVTILGILVAVTGTSLGFMRFINKIRDDFNKALSKAEDRRIEANKELHARIDALYQDKPRSSS